MSLFAFTEAEARDLASRSSRPCFAYRLDVAATRYDELRLALPPRAVLAYAVKANPGRELVAALAERGASFDCASIGELELVRSELERFAGDPGPRVLFAGPGKSLEELRFALDLGARIEADGLEDLERIEGLLAASSLSKTGNAAQGVAPEGIAPMGRCPLSVSLRVHPASGVSEGNRIIGGSGPSAFGVDEEELPAFLARASGFKFLRITGLQVFAASNERSAERLLANHRAAFAIGEALQRETGTELDLIDLGGGLGIPYAEGEEELDVAALGAGIAALLGENPWFKGRLVLEPGRWIAGPCGVYLARVVRTKLSRGVDFAVLEGGANHLLRPLLTGQGFPMKALIAGGLGRSPEARVAYTFAGPLCTSLDRLGSALMPTLEGGDLIMFGQAGAYGATEAMKDFLSRPPAEEYWL
jgi:diaminopimelate decarboxylase